MNIVELNEVLNGIGINSIILKERTDKVKTRSYLNTLVNSLSVEFYRYNSKNIELYKINDNNTISYALT